MCFTAFPLFLSICRGRLRVREKGKLKLSTRWKGCYQIGVVFPRGV